MLAKNGGVLEIYVFFSLVVDLIPLQHVQNERCRMIHSPVTRDEKWRNSNLVIFAPFSTPQDGKRGGNQKVPLTVKSSQLPVECVGILGGRPLHCFGNIVRQKGKKISSVFLCNFREVWGMLAKNGGVLEIYVFFSLVVDLILLQHVQNERCRMMHSPVTSDQKWRNRNLVIFPPVSTPQGGERGILSLVLDLIPLQHLQNERCRMMHSPVTRDQKWRNRNLVIFTPVSTPQDGERGISQNVPLTANSSQVPVECVGILGGQAPTLFRECSPPKLEKNCRRFSDHVRQFPYSLGNLRTLDRTAHVTA
jgi:mRNA-degrading endonuclease toxin of MazEF toxin-antitoxin module